jgi:hypothetical protein
MARRGRFVVSPEVEKVLGPRGLRQLDTVETFTCPCGREGHTDAGPVSVCVELEVVDDKPFARIRLAHPGCAASAVVQRPGLMRELEALAEAGRGVSSVAFFHLRGHRPRAVLIWSPYVRLMTVAALGQVVGDPWARHHLEAGFRPVRTRIEEADLPEVAGWTLRLGDSAIRLLGSDGSVAYEQDRDPGLQHWEAGAIERAVRDERLVGAVVPARR